MFTLYEQAADREFDAGNYGRALEYVSISFHHLLFLPSLFSIGYLQLVTRSLYYLSNVRTSKLIGKYLDIGRMDIVMTHLKGTLHQPEGLNEEEEDRGKRGK